MRIIKLPNLDESVLKALDFFKHNPPAKLKLKKSSLLFVVGSGNAFNTGKILFKKYPAIFASESDFQEKLYTYKGLIKSGVIKEALIISASGEKDATWEIAAAKKHGLQTTLMTCSPDSSGAQIANKVIAYRKIAEPQTYNISTYLGMIMSVSDEKAQDIKNVIKKLRLPKNYSAYNAYSFVLPNEFAEIKPMLEIKRHELFGPHLSLRAFSAGE